MKIVMSTEFDVPQYPKTENLYSRDPETHVIQPYLRVPEFGAVNRWRVTEKVDGMNIRVALLPDGDVFIGGKTDRAQLPPRLVEYLSKTVAPQMERLNFLHKGPDPLPVVLYGEGYGAGIQSGADYNAEQRFRLFDVRYGDRWMPWQTVEDVACILDIPTVPCLGIMSTTEAIAMLLPGQSIVASEEGAGVPKTWEGIIGVSEPALFDARGGRVKFKLKLKDVEASAAVRNAVFA